MQTFAEKTKPSQQHNSTWTPPHRHRYSEQGAGIQAYNRHSTGSSPQACGCNGSTKQSAATGAVQAKLMVNKPGDSFEREADDMADRVMRMPEPGVDHSDKGGCAACGARHGLQRELQAVAPSTNGAGAIAAPPQVHDVLRTPGRTLDPAVRTFMEPRFGHDLSGVRVHNDARAAESARAVQARAFTVGNDIVFGDGQYAPHHAEGRRLLAHELTHVLQQGGQNGMGPTVQRSITLTDPGGIPPHAPTAMGPFLPKAQTLDGWLDTLCPDGNWNVDPATGVVNSADRATFCGAAPTAGHAYHKTSAHPTSCECLCDLTAPGARTIAVQIDENLVVGANSYPLIPQGEAATVHPGPANKISAFTGRDFNGIPGAGATAPLAGAGRTQTLPDPPWIIFGHEVCGHARLQTGSMGPTKEGHATSPEGNRTTVDIENRVRREHSTVANSLGIRGGTFSARNAANAFVSHNGAIYRAGASETLPGIAGRCGIAVADMLNHIWRFNGDQITAATQNTLAAGEDLLIEGIDWHEVIPGETIASIATMWALPQASVTRANPQILGPVFAMHPGDRLLIPVT